MFSLKVIGAFSSLAPKATLPLLIQSAGMKDFKIKKNYDHIVIPEKPKLRVLQKVPNYNNIKPPKMQKRLILMRGPNEHEHNTKLLHKQYGIMATQGGRIKYSHIELARLHIGKKMDTDRMFAIWRIADPWQPLTKKGVGVRMGAGKGAIDHYCTPVKAGRILIELAGKCEFEEVKGILDHVARNLPFKAIAVSQEMLDAADLKKEEDKRRNTNRYTKQYVIQNNLNGCHAWLGKYDHKWFGEYV